MGDRPIYCDSDSVMFVSRLGELDPQVGTFLGNFLDDLGGQHFDEFLAVSKEFTAKRWRTASSG